MVEMCIRDRFEKAVQEDSYFKEEKGIAFKVPASDLSLIHIWTYPNRRRRQPEELGRNLAQTQQDRKDTDGETPTQYGSCAQQHTEERRFAEHFVRAPV